MQFIGYTFSQGRQFPSNGAKVDRVRLLCSEFAKEKAYHEPRSVTDFPVCKFVHPREHSAEIIAIAVYATDW